MRITFYGAARTVTGSQHLIEVNGLRLLLDCGLFQGKRAESYARNLHLPFDPRTIDLMILSHAHIDHSGNIPNLVKQGFRGDILCTYATRDLCSIMLLDSGYIQERDIEYLNKKKARRGEPLAEPLYTIADATACLQYFTSQGYDRPRAIAPGISLRLLDAGHMLGSAIVELTIEDSARGRALRLVFSGDLGREGLPILRDPTRISEADVLIMECTYGGRHHSDIEMDTIALGRIISETYKRGGMILIPAFAVGRTQQLVYTLHQMARTGAIPDLPIYVDSPLAVDATAVYRLHPECYDDETTNFMLGGERRLDPFGFERLIYTRHVSESKQLNDLKEPAVIISASGMAEAGRILHHLANRIEDPRTTILIVGWQAPDTLGRRLVDGAAEVNILGDRYRVRAEVQVLNGFSGHADHDELLAWVGAIQSKPRRTLLVHGELDAAQALAHDLADRFGIAAEIPEWKQSVEV